MTATATRYTPILRNGLSPVCSGFSILWSNRPQDASGEFVPRAVDLELCGPLIALRDHDRTRPLGAARAGNLQVWRHPHGLAIDLVLLDTPVGRLALVDIERGVIRGWSVKGRAAIGPGGRVTILRVSEISLVGCPVWATELYLNWRTTDDFK